MIEKNPALVVTQHHENQSSVVDQHELIDSLTDRLVHAVSLIEREKLGAKNNSLLSTEEAISITPVHQQIALMFENIETLIQANELPPRFIATLDQNYKRTTGNCLKLDLATSSYAYDRLFQAAIDVASRGSCSDQ